MGTASTSEKWELGAMTLLRSESMVSAPGLVWSCCRSHRSCERAHPNVKEMIQLAYLAESAWNSRTGVSQSKLWKLGCVHWAEERWKFGAVANPMDPRDPRDPGAPPRNSPPKCLGFRSYTYPNEPKSLSGGRRKAWQPSCRSWLGIWHGYNARGFSGSMEAAIKSCGDWAVDWLKLSEDCPSPTEYPEFWWFSTLEYPKNQHPYHGFQWEWPITINTWALDRLPPRPTEPLAPVPLTWAEL